MAHHQRLSPPEEITLDALIALNSWVRSEEAQALDGGRLRRAIYKYKAAALRAYMDAGIDLSPILVYVEASCRDCDEGGEQLGRHCWRCGDTGVVRLEFVQVRLPGTQIWHSPRESLKCPGALLLAMADVEAVPATSWGVGQEGIAMDYQDLAAALNVVEAWYGVPGLYAIRWWDNDPAYYTLPLGERSRTCAFCGGPIVPDATSYSASTLLLQWYDWCCASCSKQFGKSFPDFPFPLELVSASVGIWRQRRENWERHRVNRPCFFGKTRHKETAR